MKKYCKLFILSIAVIVNMITLIACSTVNAENYESPITEELQETIEENISETIIDVDTILDYRNGFKEQPTIEEIGEENLANYLFQQFNKELCYDIGNCFCHM